MSAQEIIHNISKTNNGGNLILKLDMAKAYDRLSWSFLIEVLNRFGFFAKWIDNIKRLIDIVWYSIIINGSRNDFFSSSQGLK